MNYMIYNVFLSFKIQWWWLLHCLFCYFSYKIYLFFFFFAFLVYLHLSVQFSCSFMSESLRPRGLQHTRLPCPSPTPGACSNSCPSNHLILCRPLLLLPPIFPNIRVFFSELSFASLGNLLDSGIKPASPALQADSLPSEPPKKPVLLLGLPWWFYF